MSKRKGSIVFLIALLLVLSGGLSQNGNGQAMAQEQSGGGGNGGGSGGNNQQGNNQQQGGGGGGNNQGNNNQGGNNQQGNNQQQGGGGGGNNQGSNKQGGGNNQGGKGNNKQQPQQPQQPQKPQKPPQGQGGNQQEPQQPNEQPQQPQQEGGNQQPPQQPQQPQKPPQEQYQEMQQQWQKQATQNGFQIIAPPSVTAKQQPEENGQTTNNQPKPQNSLALPSLNSFPTIRGQFFVGSANGTPNINLNDKNTSIMLGSDNSLKAKRPDGTEVVINKDALEKINSAIKLETGSEIAKSGNNFVMKRGRIEAQTKFPISFNVATKTFSVQTPTGQKEIAVLPDQAVEKAIQSEVISTVAGGTSNSKVQITELNNQPVYQVEGTNKQKMFGLFSIAISKTTFVSATSGSVVKTNQNIFSRFLDTISF